MEVLLADDEQKVLSAIRLLLEQDRQMTIVGEAVDAGELMIQLQSRCPDVLLLDWELPGLSTSRFWDEIRVCCPGLVIVALSGRAEARRNALAAGADLFVSKAEPPDRLLSALATCADRGARPVN